MELDKDGDELSLTDLDSNANVIVVGKHATIINDTDRRAEVSPFTLDYESLSKVPIVDTSIRHDCPHSGKTYLLMFSNALSVPDVNHNLYHLSLLEKRG